MKILEWQRSPIDFIRDIWGLSPERDNSLFKKGRNITWQQHDILLAIEDAINHKGPQKISVVAGHGIGKTTTFSWLIIWYLFTHINAQVPCTAPTGDQMHDVLWKEVKMWINKMPEYLQPLFEVTSSYVRMAQSPETWFARAKTARKEAPEALAGVHGEHVMFLIDEASGVAEEVYQVGEGALTGENTLVVMISNGTRNEGYFYDSHNRYSHMWRTLQFSCEDSPIVKDDYIANIVEKYGKESDEYKIRVAGQFPDSENMDEKGWVPLITEQQIIKIYDIPFIGRVKLGVDPAGEGSDATIAVGRDDFVAKVLAKEAISSPKSVAHIVDLVVQDIGIKENDVIVDNFGEGANVAKELALMNHRYDVNAVNWGEAADSEEYLNKRAECYMRARKWLLAGGMVTSDNLVKELVKVKFKRNERGKVKIMDKPTMKRAMGKSPDHCFIAGTKISTTTGYKNIENIVAGDVVITPYGFRKVIKANVSGINAPLVKVTFSNGSQLIGTGHHKIYTDNGYINLNSLSITDTISTYNYVNLIVWRTKKLLFTRARNSGFRPEVGTITPTSITEQERLPFIGQSGLTHTVKFLKTTSSIILMEIPTITALKIWHALTGVSIKANTPPKSGVKTEMLDFNASMQQESRPVSGTAVRQEKNFTANSDKHHGTNSRLGSALCAVKNFLATSLRPTNVVAVAVEHNYGIGTVYNLTIEEDGVYYANDVLVSNSDAFALTFYDADSERTLNPTHMDNNYYVAKISKEHIYDAI